MYMYFFKYIIKETEDCMLKNRLNKKQKLFSLLVRFSFGQHLEMFSVKSFIQTKMNVSDENLSP